MKIDELLVANLGMNFDALCVCIEMHMVRILWIQLIVNKSWR